MFNFEKPKNLNEWEADQQERAEDLAELEKQKAHYENEVKKMAVAYGEGGPLHEKAKEYLEVVESKIAERKSLLQDKPEQN